MDCKMKIIYLHWQPWSLHGVVTGYVNKHLAKKGVKAELQIIDELNKGCFDDVIAGIIVITTITLITALLLTMPLPL